MQFQDEQDLDENSSLDQRLLEAALETDQITLPSLPSLTELEATFLRPHDSANDRADDNSGNENGGEEEDLPRMQVLTSIIREISQKYGVTSDEEDVFEEDDKSRMSGISQVTSTTDGFLLTDPRRGAGGGSSQILSIHPPQAELGDDASTAKPSSKHNDSYSRSSMSEYSGSFSNHHRIPSSVIATITEANQTVRPSSNGSASSRKTPMEPAGEHSGSDDVEVATAASRDNSTTTPDKQDPESNRYPFLAIDETKDAEVSTAPLTPGSDPSYPISLDDEPSIRSRGSSKNDPQFSSDLPVRKRWSARSITWLFAVVLAGVGLGGGALLYFLVLAKSGDDEDNSRSSSNQSDQIAAPQATRRPTPQPTLQPTPQATPQPTAQPTTVQPTPSSPPVETVPDTTSPTQPPTSIPTTSPTKTITSPPGVPTVSPSVSPSGMPSSRPSVRPSQQPSLRPSFSPSSYPSESPSSVPSSTPSFSPSQSPSAQPSTVPTMIPSSQPSESPTSLETTLLEIITTASSQSAALISVLDSPQNLAFNWLMSDTRFEDHSHSRITQRYAMAVFYFSTGGPTSWTDNSGWADFQDECFWYNLRYPPCTSGSKELLFLDLSNNNLQGSIPFEIGLLTKLRRLKLSGNTGLTGPVPSQIGDIVQLEQIELDNTSVNGNLPSELGQIPTLTKINFANARLTGNVPVEIGNLLNLDELLLANTAMTGAMPDEVCDLDPPSQVSWNCEPGNICPCCTYCCYLRFGFCGAV